MSRRPQPDAELVVSSLETLKVLSNPIRVRLLEVLGETPKSVKQMAADVSEPQTKLYRHIRLLEEHGLIRVTGTRIVSGIEEKYYQVTARRIRVSESLLTPDGGEGEAGLDMILRTVLDQTRLEIGAGVRAGVIDFSCEPPEPRALLAMRGYLHLTPKQARAFSRRLMKLFKDVEQTEERTDTKPYGFATVFYPAQRSEPTANRKPPRGKEGPRGKASPRSQGRG